MLVDFLVLEGLEENVVGEIGLGDILVETEERGVDDLPQLP